MNDRYLFRAKRLDNEKWEIGSLIALPNGEYEIADKCQNSPDSDPIWKKCVITRKVDKKTVCQCTGLKDKNGAKIFEGDIINSKWGKFVIIYNATFGGFVAADDGSGCGWEFLDEVGEIEVIGNIHDNPELLKVDADDE